MVVIGGDGCFSEYVNGYLLRARKLNIPPEKRTPVCLIPAGTGNSFARDLYGSTHLGESFALSLLLTPALGCIKLVDVCSLRDSSASLDCLSTNVVSWGLVGDTAVIAEEFRQFGDWRYDLCAVWNLLRQINHKGRFVIKHLAEGGKNWIRGKENMRFKGDRIQAANGKGKHSSNGNSYDSNGFSPSPSIQSGSSLSLSGE